MLIDQVNLILKRVNHAHKQHFSTLKSFKINKNPMKSARFANKIRTR